MACPAGYSSADVPASNPPYPFTKPNIHPTIAEPDKLKELVDESIYLLGGQFAILCQFAHPGLAEGSYKHSNFAYRIMNRLQTTARFLNAAVFGTLEEKQAIFSVIHAAHADVKGENYYADDPELHKWTAATLFVSLIVVHETFFGKMESKRVEQLYQESAVYGTSLRMHPAMWPATLSEFWEYWNHNLETLQITDWAKSLAKDLMYPKNMPLWFKPNAPIARLLTIYWLPERFRREYGFKITPFRTMMFHKIVAHTALIYPAIPKSVRQWPSRFYMKDMKKAVKRIEATGRWDTTTLSEKDFEQSATGKSPRSINTESHRWNPIDEREPEALSVGSAPKSVKSRKSVKSLARSPKSTSSVEAGGSGFNTLDDRKDVKSVIDVKAEGKEGRKEDKWAVGANRTNVEAEGSKSNGVGIIRENAGQPNSASSGTSSKGSEKVRRW